MSRVWGTLMGVLACACALAQPVAPKDPITVTISPVFLGTLQPRFCSPMEVVVENQGKDAQGMLTVSCDSFRMRYPVQAPSNSKKSFIAYVTLPYDSYGPTIEASFTSNLGTFGAKFERSIADQADACAVIVHDREGALNFVTQRTNAQGGQSRPVERIAPSGTKPEEAPDRMVGYLGINAVVLSEGAERMDELRVRALQEWVTAGGTLYIFGGAGSPVQRDPRWTPFWPVNFESSGLSTAPGFEGTVPYQSARLASGAKEEGRNAENKLFRASRSVGAGRVVWMAIDPVSSPLRERPATAGWLRKVLVQGSPSFRAALALSASGQSFVPGMPLPGMPALPRSDDPFDAKLPSATQLFGILAGYAFVVVLVNLLVLRALKRGELAWVTTPIISLVFAMLIFRFAGNLYSAQLSRATQGLVFLDSTGNRSVFLGRVQLFFPRGGAYAIPMEGLQTMMAFRSTSWTPNATSVFNAFDPVDIGEVMVPRASVPNLSFQEFYAFQSLPSWGTIKGATSAETRNSLQAEVVNGTNLEFSEAYVVRNGTVYQLGPIKPGQTLKKKADFINIGSQMGGLVQERLPKSGTYFLGRTTRAPVGPTIGDPVVQRDEVFVVTSL